MLLSSNVEHRGMMQTQQAAHAFPQTPQQLPSDDSILLTLHTSFSCAPEECYEASPALLNRNYCTKDHQRYRRNLIG
jgi:hypothetical protein